MENKVCIGLCILAMTSIVFLATPYGRFGRTSSQYQSPFITDRVVTLRLTMPEKDWQSMTENAHAKQYVRADFSFDGQHISNVAVRPKGNSSLRDVVSSGSTRLSLKIDFNFFNVAQTFRGLKKINLNNGFSDPSLMRETLGYKLFEQMGLPTPRTAFVDLWVNDTHLGLYTQVEQVDKGFLSRHFAHANGNLYKPEVGAGFLAWTQSDLPEQTDETRALESLAAKQSINLGGARLNDLLNLLQRENNLIDPNQATRGPGFGGPMGPPPGGGSGPEFSGGPRPFEMDPNGDVGSPDGFGPPPGFGPGGPEGFGPPPGFGQSGPGGFSGDFGPDGPDDQDPNAIRGRRGRGMRGRPDGPGGAPGGAGRGNLLETMGLKTNEDYQDHTALFKLLDILNNCPDETFPAKIETILDVDATLRYLAVSVMIVHLDNYIGMGHNYYLYLNDGKFTPIPWDLNMAFGVFDMGVTQSNITDFTIDKPTTSALSERPLVGRLLGHAPYMDTYHKYLEQMLAGCFKPGPLEKRIDEIAAQIRPFVQADPTKLFTLDQFDQSISLSTESPSQDSMSRPQDNQPANTLQPRQDRPSRQGPGRRRGPGGPGGQRGPGGMSGTGLALKPFLAQRRVSVQKQLSGELPSKPTAEEENNNMPGGFMPLAPGEMR